LAAEFNYQSQQSTNAWQLHAALGRQMSRINGTSVPLLRL
jgi:hypothetical protein